MRHGLLAAFALAATGLLGVTFLILQPVSPAVRLANEVDFDALIPAATLGSIIAPKKALNESARAELGRSTWRLLHTMAQRYPDKPTDDERQTFKSFIYLLSRLYPCAECAAHFQTMLKQYPPQTANRNTASLYLCMLHNEVNVRLNKEEFDCSKLDGLYDCGCGDEGDGKARPAIGAGGDLDADDKRDPVTGETLVEG